jgi:hypothetical protein
MSLETSSSFVMIYVKRKRVSTHGDMSILLPTACQTTEFSVTTIDNKSYVQFSSQHHDSYLFALNLCHYTFVKFCV